MPQRTKYKKRYAQELLAGLRRTPYETSMGKEYSWSIERLCWHWGISQKTYYNWRAEYKSFDEACEIGDRDYQMYWLEKIEDGVSQGKNANGALLKFVATNVLGWSDKKEVKHEGQSRIGTVNINILEAPKKDVLQLIPDNVININAERAQLKSDTDTD